MLRRLLSLLVVTLTVAATLVVPATTASAAGSLESAELEVVRLHNQARAAAGLAPLDVHVTIHTEARDWSRYMAGRGQLEHQSRANGYNPDYVATSCAGVDPNWRGCAENIAWGSQSAADVHRAWMNSTGHRRNILNPAYNRVGVGVWRDGNGRLWWTARFLAGTTRDTADSTRHPQDGTPTYDANGPQGTVYRLYRAYFGRQPDSSGYEYWLTQYNLGYPLTSISDEFARSLEYRTRYGSTSNRDFITLVYRNVLGRRPDASGYSYWLEEMRRGVTRGELMIYFSDSSEYRTVTRSGIPDGYRRA